MTMRSRGHMPSLVGLTTAQEVDKLRQAGWTGTSAQISQTTQDTFDTNSVGRVVSQQPAAGSAIAKNGIPMGSVLDALVCARLSARARSQPSVLRHPWRVPCCDISASIRESWPCGHEDDPAS
ncbi:PASTA domain-containing protein [Nocardia sp. CA-135398]|uniref:PASTA domain-containing protein n=1 Tax=Nocardia sp. CA-135398 TaxID=3239977 RepID=UPI003D95BDF7